MHINGVSKRGNFAKFHIIGGRGMYRIRSDNTKVCLLKL